MYHGTQRKIVNADYVKRRLTHVNKPFLLGYEHKGIYTELEKRYSTNDELMKEVEHLQTQAKYVHHIVPLKDNFQLELVDDNLVSLCFRCHEIVEGRDDISKYSYKKQIVSEEKW